MSDRMHLCSSMLKNRHKWTNSLVGLKLYQCGWFHGYLGWLKTKCQSSMVERSWYMCVFIVPIHGWLLVCIWVSSAEYRRGIYLNEFLQHSHQQEALNRTNYSITFQTLLLKSRQFWLWTQFNGSEKQKPADVALCVKYTWKGVLFVEEEKTQPKKPIKNVAKISASTFPVCLSQAFHAPSWDV